MSTDLPNLALVGKMGAGKTTIAESLEHAFGYTRLSIASPLKSIAVQIWGDSADRDRSKLQPLGQAVRAIDEDAWANLLLSRIDVMQHQQPEAHFVVDDCRFPNEYWKLREYGFVVVRVEAPVWLRVDRLKSIGKLQDEAQLEDTSETALDGFEADYTVTNEASLDELAIQVQAILKREWVRS